MEAAPGEVAHHEPEVRHAGVAPSRLELAFLVEAPDRLDALGEVFPADARDRSGRAGEAIERQNTVSDREV